MPNHVTNMLTVQGDSEEIKALFAAIKGNDEHGGECFIDFNKITPMPESMNIEAGSQTQKGLELYQQFMQEHALFGHEGDADFAGKQQNLARHTEKYKAIKENDPALWQLGKQAFENIQAHGAATWHDWSVAHWGAKWNAYTQSQPAENVIEFHTAWAGVPDLMQRLSRQFPTLHFSYTFADENWGCNVGEYEFLGGEQIACHRPKGGSPEAHEIARELLGPAPWEREEEFEMEME